MTTDEARAARAPRTNAGARLRSELDQLDYKDSVHFGTWDAAILAIEVEAEAAIRAEYADYMAMATLRAFTLALDTLVVSDPQDGYSRERQRGWDEGIASVRSLLRAVLDATEAQRGDL